MHRLPLGNSDFRSLRQNDALYVDKTAGVAQVLTDEAMVTLFCRPRRFGKTLFLSTLRYFVEATEEDRSALYANLTIWQNPTARTHFQQYPVIWLSFKEVKGESWEEASERLWLELRACVEAMSWLEEHPKLTKRERARLTRWMDGAVTVAQWGMLLRELTALLYKATGKRAVVLIDEYDTPIHSAWTGGFYDKMVGFFHSFLGAGLKDNPALHKAVLTGILRVAREGMFSSLNHLTVVSVLDRTHPDSFGFTEPEVDWLQQQTQSPHTMEVLRGWYNGYHIGTCTVYNPWSILSCLSRPDDPPQPYWVNTGSTEQIADQIWRGDAGFLRDLQALMQGGTVQRHIPDATPLPGMKIGELRAMLLHAGYYTARSIERLPDGWDAALTVPNRDVVAALYTLVRRWVDLAQPQESAVRNLLSAMLNGHMEVFERELGALVARALSFHDLVNPDPDRVFHAFVLGLLVLLEQTHLVWSNVESGDGRVDALVIPKVPGGTAVILEFKKVDEERDIDAALLEAVRQIGENRYAVKLTEAEAGVIRGYGVVCWGKRVRVRAV